MNAQDKKIITREIKDTKHGEEKNIFVCNKS
jgi:hypothetical protein